MKASKLPQAQIAFVLPQAEDGAPDHASHRKIRRNNYPLLIRQIKPAHDIFHGHDESELL